MYDRGFVFFLSRAVDKTKVYASYHQMNLMYSQFGRVICESCQYTVFIFFDTVLVRLCVFCRRKNFVYSVNIPFLFVVKHQTWINSENSSRNTYKIVKKVGLYYYKEIKTYNEQCVISSIEKKNMYIHIKWTI